MCAGFVHLLRLPCQWVNYSFENLYVRKTRFVVSNDDDDAMCFLLRLPTNQPTTRLHVYYVLNAKPLHCYI